MKQSIINTLKEQFPKQRTDGLELLAGSLTLVVKSPEEAKALVSSWTDEAVEQFVKGYRSSVDRETSQAIESYKANAHKDETPKPSETPHKPSETPHKPSETKPATDMAGLIAEAIGKALKPFEERMAGFEDRETARTRGERLSKALEASQSVAFREQASRAYGRMTFKDEAEFEAYLQDLAQDIEASNKEASREALGGFPKPFRGGGEDGGKPSTEAVDAILDFI